MYRIVAYLSILAAFKLIWTHMCLYYTVYKIGVLLLKFNYFYLNIQREHDGHTCLSNDTAVL